jgi:hypothetical protein
LKLTYVRCWQGALETQGQAFLHGVGVRFEQVASLPDFAKVAHHAAVMGEVMLILDIMHGVALVCMHPPPIVD